MLLEKIADIHHQIGRIAEAEPLLRRSVALIEKTFGAEHIRVAPPLCDLGCYLMRTDRIDEAREAFARALAIVEKTVGTENFRAAEALWGLARCARMNGEREAAVSHLARAEPLCEKDDRVDKTLRARVLAERAWHYYHEDRSFDEAESRFKKALELMATQISDSSLEVREIARDYAALLKTVGRWNEAWALAAKHGGRVR